MVKHQRVNSPDLLRHHRNSRHLILRSLAVLVFSSVLLTAHSSSQQKSIKQFVQEVYTTANGLPQNSGHALCQSKDGFIWVATEEGLARFDGMGFTIFDRTNTPEFRHSFFVLAIQDSSGTMWFRPTFAAPGLYSYSNDKFTYVDTSNGLPSNNTSCVSMDSKGSAFFGTDKGVAEFRGGTHRVYSRRDGLPSDSINAIVVDHDDVVWVGTTRGLAWIVNGVVTQLPPALSDLRTASFGFMVGAVDHSNTVWLQTSNKIVACSKDRLLQFDTKTVSTARAIFQVKEDRRGTLWFMTTNGLTSYSNGKFTTSHLSTTPGGDIINAIAEDRSGALWVATNFGLVRVVDSHIEHFTKADGLTDNQVFDVLVDREGTVWTGTSAGGVNRFRDEKFVTYTSRDGASYDMVMCVTEDSKGNVYFGAPYGSVNKLANDTVSVLNPKIEPAISGVRAVWADNDGTLWLGSFLGLYSMKDGRATAYSHLVNGRPDLLATSILRARDGTLYIGDRNKLRKFVNHRFELVGALWADSTSDYQINELHEDRSGRIWIATGSGTWWYEHGSFHLTGADEGIPHEWMQGFHEDSSGTFWFGIFGQGLFRFRNGKCTSITPLQGFFDYTVYSVLEDDNGYLWMSSNKGVWRVRKSEVNDVMDGKAERVHCTVYGTADGMQVQECNGGYSPPAWKLHDGRLCFPTVKGLAIVNPAVIRINEVPPPVVIEEFLVEGQRSSTTGQLTVPAGKNRFEFHYAGLSFVGSKDVRYKYQLVGQDKDWIDAGNRREVSYTNLSPGEYTFRVIAANADGIWNTTGASVRFILQPHFYETTWFIGLCILFFLTSGPLFYWNRMRAMKSRREELERTVQERTGELQQTVANLRDTQNQLILSEKMASLGQLTAGIAHEIKNPLNFITNFSVLSKDLTADLRKELAAEREKVDPKRAEEIDALLGDLEQNVVKINEHGKRADSIVRGMLLHSRGKAGERQSTDLNALLAEYTNLAYHGMRAQDQSFNVKIETNLDSAVGMIEIVPQDLSRAFLNIVNNACYAANDKRKSAGPDFMPAVRVASKNLPGKVEIRIRDNGNGIPASVREKIFNPFFTTKPAGVGTGLGLSLTYDIITQEHKGTIAVETKEGQFTEFILTIPRDLPEEKGAAA
jgi:ligand-binding sensor domain-containing protein/signal transduction histidine kinase